MPDNQKRKKSKARDFRGLNNSRPSSTERGLLSKRQVGGLELSNPTVREYISLAEQFLDSHRQRITREASSMNVNVAQKDFDYAQSAIRSAKVLPLRSIKRIDSSSDQSTFGFYDPNKGQIYLQEEWVKRWIKGGSQFRIWEVLIHESKHALLDSAFGNSKRSEDDEHLVSQWLFPYYINE